ncbi:MAG: M48 family metalloprotease [Pseudomonadota bacterium]|nr:M48 family metalloprotease [Pseudomonadota bacterium]
MKHAPPNRVACGRRIARALAALAIAALAAGCATIEPQIAPPPKAAPVAAAPPKPAVDPEKRRLMAAFGGEYVAPGVKAYLDNLLARLAPASETPTEPYRVTLLDSPVVNAFALPSGDIFVTRGLLALAGDGAEAAAVMAHEIGHITAHHASQRAELERQGRLFSRVSTQLLERPEQGEEYVARTKLTVARFSREQEFEADRIGIRVIAKAGYDPYAAARFLDKLGRWSALHAGGGGANAKPDMMATHPSTPERIAAAVALAKQIGPKGIGDAARDSYLSAIDGLAYGDNPAQGLAVGTLFVHPKLGFAVRAPEGFALENQSTALIGVGEAGTQALRLDSIDAGSASLEQALASGWIDGVQTNSIETLKDTDLPTAVAVAKGDQWTFRLAAIRLGSRIYRLIFAAHTLSGPVDASFLASIRSFHRVNADESGLARQPHIHIVTAEPGDDAASLARGMAGAPYGEETFLILNGLQSGAATPVGQRYKTIGP